MKSIITATVILIVGLGALFVFELGVEKQEKSECLKFQDQALNFPNFYLTQHEKDQCDRWEIKIDAPVKKLPRM